jgi:hypothetical protein
MKNALGIALAVVLALAAGCSSTGGGFSLPESLGGGVTKTFKVPVAKVKPVFVGTVSSMGMAIAAVEMRGKNEVVKARRADRSVEMEFERVDANSTRVRVTGSDQAAIMREAEKRLGAAAG